MTTRRAFVAGALSVLVAPRAGLAQPAGKVWRIGYLSLAPVEAERSRLAVFRQELRELGYLEGHNIVIDERYAAGQAGRLPGLAAELLRLNVDVILAFGDAAAMAAKNATRTIPIVMSGADPVGLGIVASLTRPGGNITGLTDSHADLVPKRLELLREIGASVSRVAVVFNPASPIAAPQLKAVQEAAAVLRMTVVPVQVTGLAPGDFDPASDTIRKARPGGLLVIAEPAVAVHRGRIAALAIKSGIASIGTFRVWAEDGFLMSYGTVLHSMARRRAAFVDKILKGAKPSDLPVEQPTKFELVINAKTAKALGLTIPPSLRLRADHVIE